MKNVEDYLNAPDNIFSPWADNPGVKQDTPYLSCRRTYHLFLTDGAWDNAGTTSTPYGDDSTQLLPDGTSYSPTAVASGIYADGYGVEQAHYSASTLSDFAFSSWARDFQDGREGTPQVDYLDNKVTGPTRYMENNVRPLIRRFGPELFKTTKCSLENNCKVTPEYWNPKNDPATWQHVTQYTIGFGLGAISWDPPAGTPQPWSANNSEGSTYGGDFSKLVQGEVKWADVITRETPNIRVADLWHMAINGRGKFYAAANADALDAAFDDILGTVIADSSLPVRSISTNSSRLGTSTSAFLAGYRSDKYSGSLIARPLDRVTGAMLPTNSWSAAASLDAVTDAAVSRRFVFSSHDDVGIPWKRLVDLPAAQRDALSLNSAGSRDGSGQDRLDYLRGVRSKEISQSGGVFRDRDSRLGDIVNSSIWYLAKPASGYGSSSYAAFRGTGADGKGGRLPVVYVGANDGMLHGFAAESWPKTSPTVAGGTEVLAYIPRGVAEGSLRYLTYPNYTHKYFVDASPITGDAEIGVIPRWTTVLLGALGLGGKGYFLLDVSDPQRFTEANVSELVIADTTASRDLDLGHIVSPPVIDEKYASKSRQIVKMNDERWAVVLGNGVNSSNEAPVLLIQYLDGDKAVIKVSPCGQPIADHACTHKGSNGLATPQLIDLNGDGKVDVAYAGDLKGNLWKFNLSSSTNTHWKVAFDDEFNPNGRPFFIAKQGAQSFTTAPFWMAHPRGGISIVIGTGRNLTDNDQTDTSSVQSLYSLWDNNSVTSDPTSGSRGSPINLAADVGVASNLVLQTLSSTPVVDDGVSYYASSANDVDYSTKRGWYMNLSASTGQRVLQNIRLYEGQKMLVQTTIPSTSASSHGESCTPSGSEERNFISVLNTFTGKPSSTPVFTLTNAALGNANLSTREIAGSGVAILRGINKIKAASTSCASGSTCAPLDLNMSRYTGARGNWQQLQ